MNSNYDKEEIINMIRAWYRKKLGVPDRISNP